MTADRDRDRLVALLRRAAKQITAWHEKYGEHAPAWLPPAGDVRLLENISEALAPAAPREATESTRGGS